MGLHPAGKQPWWTTPRFVSHPGAARETVRKAVIANGLLWWFGPGGDEW